MNEAEPSVPDAGENIPDEILMQRFRESDDESAFDELISRYYRPALVVARGRLPSRADLAEDAVQEAFIRTVRHRDRFDCRRPFAAWFYAILRNVCVDFGRKETRREQQIRELTLEQERAADERQTAPDAMALLRALSPGDREILVYRFIHGLSLQEIAEQLGISEEAAKKRAQRALKQLRAAAPEENPD